MTETVINNAKATIIDAIVRTLDLVETCHSGWYDFGGCAEEDDINYFISQDEMEYNEELSSSLGKEIYVYDSVDLKNRICEKLIQIAEDAEYNYYIDTMFAAGRVIEAEIEAMEQNINDAYEEFYAITNGEMDEENLCALNSIGEYYTLKAYLTQARDLLDIVIADVLGF